MVPNDKQVERQLQLPVRATMDESYQLVRLCNEAEAERASVALDCSATTRFGPFGVTCVAALIATRKQQGRQTTLLSPEDAQAVAFVEEVGLMRFARGSATGIGTLEVRQMSALDATYTDAVTAMVVRGVPGISSENSYPIQLCLNELLQNVFEWAESPVGCFVLARWYHATRTVRLSVVDRGIGIPAALRRGRTRDLHRASDADVIHAAATMPRLTSRASQVGGLGLKNVREVVLGRGGHLTILSLTAKVLWSPRTVRRYKSPGFRGTAIEIEFRPDAPIERPHEYVPVF